jgi:hypothetical protein
VIAEKPTPTEIECTSFGVPIPHRRQQRFEQRRHCGLADPAEAEACQRDPELRGGDRVVEPLDRVRRCRCAALARL